MKGKQITLRPIIKDDLPDYFKWINNRELVLYNSNFKPVSITEHHQWFDSISLRKDILVFSILENQNNQLIGSCSLRNINYVHKNAELQIRIGALNYQDNGLGTEAVHLLTNHAFNNLDMERVYLHVFSDNARAIKTYHKCGYETEGLLRNAAFIDDKYINVNIMAILKSTLVNHTC